MAKVSMQQVKELRERTQAGLNDCKSALEEAGGDIESAVEIILKKGLAKSAKRAGAIAAEGQVAAKVSEDGRHGVIAEVNIQTDFAARNEEFVAFVRKVVEVAMSAKEGEDLLAKADPSGGGSLEDTRQRLVAKLGENVAVRRWGRLDAGEAGRVHAYVHMGGKIGSLVKVSTGSDAAARKPELLELVENLAMQIVATTPLYVSKDQVADDARSKQTEIFNAQLEEEGKPEKVRPRIVEGKLAKWMKEICLLDQASVVETDRTVAQVVEAAAKAVGSEIVVDAFLRFERGEGIEKKKDDFAAEAAKMSKG